jgi:chromosome segregation ATPase
MVKRFSCKYQVIKMSDDEDDITNRLNDMKIAVKNQKKDMMETIKRLEATILQITTERDEISEDYAALSDRIAELEAKDKVLKNRESFPYDDDPNPGDDSRPKLDIPEWRIAYITNRIAQGERPTIYNMMYIDSYSKEDRYNRAKRFRTKIINAFKDHCINFAHEKGISDEDNEIPQDFEEVKMKLHDLATVNNREFIRSFFKGNM